MINKNYSGKDEKKRDDISTIKPESVLVNKLSGNDSLKKQHQNPNNLHLDSEYYSWISNVKNQYIQTEKRIKYKVNSEKIAFYWGLGRDLVFKNVEAKWGTGVIKQISKDLSIFMEKTKGVSTRQLWDIKKWYLFYATDSSFQNKLNKILMDVDLTTNRMKQIGKLISTNIQQKSDLCTIVQKSVISSALIDNNQIVVQYLNFPPLFGFLPYYHHIYISSCCSSIDEALFYILKSIQFDWTLNQLKENINQNLYKNISDDSFDNIDYLYQNDFDLYKEIKEEFKDNYPLPYIQLPSDYIENDLQKELEKNIRLFKHSLGDNFLYVDSQFEMNVSGTTRKIDMLWLNKKLKSNVIIELKSTSFKDEYLGQLSAYLSDYDRLYKRDDENDSIGLLICRDKDKTQVKWLINDYKKNIFVSTYSDISIKDQLPSEEKLASEVDEILKIEKIKT